MYLGVSPEFHRGISWSYWELPRAHTNFCQSSRESSQKFSVNPPAASLRYSENFPAALGDTPRSSRVISLQFLEHSTQVVGKLPLSFPWTFEGFLWSSRGTCLTFSVFFPVILRKLPWIILILLWLISQNSSFRTIFVYSSRRFSTGLVLSSGVTE